MVTRPPSATQARRVLGPRGLEGDYADNDLETASPGAVLSPAPFDPLVPALLERLIQIEEHLVAIESHQARIDAELHILRNIIEERLP
jgi:hypothetical protein